MKTYNYTPLHSSPFSIEAANAREADKAARERMEADAPQRWWTFTLEDATAARYRAEDREYTPRWAR